MAETQNADWMPDGPLLLTKAQAAALLNVSVRTITNLLARRELVRRRVGGKALIPRTSIEAFLRKDHITQTDEQKEARRLRETSGRERAEDQPRRRRKKAA